MTASLSALTRADITTISNEPRIQDVRIGERLGMAQPLDIRRTIEVNRPELERYGAIFAHRPKNTDASATLPVQSDGVFTDRVKTPRKRGRPATAYYLNEPQTLLLCMLSRTERAADVRQEVIGLYMAYRRDQAGCERSGVQPGPGAQLQDDGRYLVVMRGRQMVQSIDLTHHCMVNGHDPVNVHTFLREYVAADALPAALDAVLGRICARARTNADRRSRDELLLAMARASAALTHNIAPGALSISAKGLTHE